MLKYFIPIMFLITTFLNAGIGTLRIIADFGSRDNISIKNCTSSQLDDFLFLNDDPNDTSMDLILNRPGFTTLHLCSPDLLNSTETNMKYKDFKPTLILFNDQGTKGVPSLYNKKLVASSSINTIILTYIFQNMEDNPDNVLSLKELYKQLSKFNINNFYLAIDYDSYEALNNQTKLKGFFKYLDAIPAKIKDDELSEQVFKNKISQLKDLYKFSLDLYSKVYKQYQRLYTKSYIDIWQSGYTKEFFCQIDDTGDFINTKTATAQTAQNCYNCIEKSDSTTDCSVQCHGIKGFEACQKQTDSLKTLNECYYENCIGPLENKDIFRIEESLNEWIYFIKFGVKSEALSTIPQDYYDFVHIPYTNITDGIVKLPDGSINENATANNRNSICREKITDNLAETFNFYSDKLSYRQYQDELTFDLNNYPTLKEFYSIVMDIHSIFLTNDIQNLINDLVNTECISGNFNNNVDENGNHLNYQANKKLINYVDVLKFNGTTFYEYSNKMFALNMLGNFMPRTINPGTTSTVGTVVEVDNTILPGGGGLDTGKDFTIDLEENSKCKSDESLLILYYDNLSNNNQDPKTLNAYLNKEITGNENSGFFDVENYQLYLGCYKQGYISKFVGKYSHNLLDKDLLLSCYSKWLNEPTIATGDVDSTKTVTNTTATCVDYFYNNLSKDELENIYSKFADSNNDLVVFASIVHFNIFNSKNKFDEILNGSPEIDKNTVIFKNIIPTIPYNSMDIEDYTLKETVCEKISDYEIVEVKDENGTTIIDENGDPVTEIIKGEYQCYNNTSNQDLYNYQHQYVYNVQDYIMMLNAYSPVKLSDIGDFTLSQKNSINLNNEYKAFSTEVSKNETKDCPIIYLNPANVDGDTYVSDNRYCLGNGKYYSDYNTELKPYIRLKFTDYISPIIAFANNNGIYLEEPITEESFYTGEFPADTAFLFKPVFDNHDNDIYLYEINQEEKDDIANYINGSGNYNNVIRKTMVLNTENDNIDTTLYNITYTDQNIDIMDFSQSSLNQLSNMDVITK